MSHPARPIMLSDILPINNLPDYKVHFARYNQENQPLDVFTKDRQEWQGWQEYRPARDDFNRPVIFSLAIFYYEPAAWLLCGIFRVLARPPDAVYLIKYCRPPRKRNIENVRSCELVEYADSNRH